MLDVGGRTGLRGAVRLLLGLSIAWKLRHR
jgi:hypothetical protein